MNAPKKNPAILDKCAEVIALEEEQILLRRQKLYGPEETAKKLKETRFGIALSGGGIRSATINLGLLKTLNKFGILQRADYLSTVSGGGYTGAYIQATLKDEGDYDQLFDPEHTEYMRSRGEYLMPGMGWGKRWNTLVLTVGYLFSLLMSLLSPGIIIVLVAMIYSLITNLAKEAHLSTLSDLMPKDDFNWFAAVILLGVFVVHFFANITGAFSLGISKQFNKLEAVLVSIVLLWMALLFISDLGAVDMEAYGFTKYHYFILPILLILLGFFTNPNSVSFHRFYRNQLSDAFLHFTGPYRNVKLHELFDAYSDKKSDYMAPYPLINTCLNLQAMGGEDPRFKGAKASDYFLMSPLYCGSKLSKYANTKESFPDFENMTLPAAITISAAAVNPGMGMYSNKLLSVLMTIFNARLGFWVSNPLRYSDSALIWWPIYFFKELLSSMGTANKKLNISDGGHIENLAVYELLRRRCRLILAVDAGADPLFTFMDLENLTIRARNELGLDLCFRPDQIPEECLRPKPSHGYSQRRFAVADIYQLWDEITVKTPDGKTMTDGKGAEIEVLVNYKKLRHSLQLLSEEEHWELCKIMTSLNLENQVRYLLNNPDLEGHASIKETLQSLKLKRNIRVTFESALTILQGVKKVLIPIEKETDREEAYRQIVAAIERQVRKKLKMGTFVYIKSSVTAPEGKPLIPRSDELKYAIYKYKIYHPSFPHEPTSDQFFDRIQWESYFQLGEFIGADVLGIDDLSQYQRDEKTGLYPKNPFPIGLGDLIERFDEEKDLFVPPIKKEIKTVQPPLVTNRPLEISPMEPMAPAGVEEEVAREMESPAAAPTKDKKVVVGEEVNFKM